MLEHVDVVLIRIYFSTSAITPDVIFRNNDGEGKFSNAKKRKIEAEEDSTNKRKKIEVRIRYKRQRGKITSMKAQCVRHPIRTAMERRNSAGPKLIDTNIISYATRKIRSLSRKLGLWMYNTK